MINLLLTLLLSCGGGLTGSKTKDADPNNGKYNSNNLNDGLYDNDDDYEDNLGIEIFTNALNNGDLREFEELLEYNPELLTENFANYNLNEYSRGGNNLVHAIVNTSGIDKKDFLEVVKRLDYNGFNISIKQKNSAGYFPSDIAFLERDWDTFKYFMDAGIAVETGFSKDSLRSSIKYLVDERRIDIFEMLEDVWANNRSYEGKRGTFDGKDIKKSYKLYRERDDENRDAIYYICKNLDREMFDWIMDKFPNLNVDYSDSGFVGFRDFLDSVLKKAWPSNPDKAVDYKYMLKKVENNWKKKEFKKY